MTKKRAWSPADGPAAAPQQKPNRPILVHGDGTTERAQVPNALWAPTEGPMRSDPGGPGGEPDGKTISIPGRTGLNEP